jgi:hypothetical protein
MLLGGKQFEISVSVPLILEYEDAAKRLGREFGLTHADIEDILDYVCSVADLREIHFLWRPILKDPQDDHVLELAVESSAFAVTSSAGKGSRKTRRDFYQPIYCDSDCGENVGADDKRLLGGACQARSPWKV